MIETPLLAAQVQAIQSDLMDLTEKVGGLTASINHLLSSWERNDAMATEGRRQVHNKLDSFKDEVHSKINVMSAQLQTLSRKVDVIEPSVHGFNEEKLRTEGAKRFGAKLWAGTVAAAGVLGWLGHHFINAVLEYLKAGSPPHP